MHYCNKCQQLESYVSFSEKEKATAPPAGPGEALSKYFKTATEWQDNISYILKKGYREIKNAIFANNIVANSM